MAGRIPMPSDVVRMTLLDRVDYGDAFRTMTPVSMPPEHWARLGTSGASPALLAFVRTVQQTLGLRLQPLSPDHPLGWDIAHNEPERFVLAAEGPLGSARIVWIAPPGAVVIATMLRFDNSASRVAWRLVAPIHRAVARYGLDRTAKVTLARQLAAAASSDGIA